MTTRQTREAAAATLEMSAVYVDLYRRLQVWNAVRRTQREDDEFLAGVSKVGLAAAGLCGRTHQRVKTALAEVDVDHEQARRLNILAEALADLTASFVQFVRLERRDDLPRLTVAGPSELVDRLTHGLGDWLDEGDIRVSGQLLSRLTFLRVGTD